MTLALDQPVTVDARRFRLYAEAMRCGDDEVAVEHAALPRTRLPEAFITALIARATQTEEPSVGYVTPALSRDRFAIEAVLATVFGKATKAYSAGGCVAYRVHDGLLWLIDAKHAQMGDLPFGNLDDLTVIDGHLVDRNLIDGLRRLSARITVVGAPSRQGEWFYDWSREPSTTLFKFNVVDVCSTYPDQLSFALSEDEPDYNRLMLCEDDKAAGQLVPFGSFAKRRLKVRTDKTAAFLTPAQRAEAASQHGTPVVSFELSRLQRKYRAMKRRAVMRGRKPWYLLLKYRRGGFTTEEQGENYAYVVQRPRSYVACLADTKDKTSRIFRMAKTFHEHDPRAPQLVGDSKSALEFGNGSFYFIGTAGSSGFARGDTLQRVHGSEISKWCHGDQDKVEEVMAGILGATEHGTVVLETTPNGIEWFAHNYRAAKRGDNDFTPIFLRWFDDPGNRLLLEDEESVLDTLTEEEKRLMVAHSLVAEQIAFRRDRKRAFGKLFPQEYPEDDETCFIVSGTPFFDYEIITGLMDSIASPPLADNGSGVFMPEGAKHVPGGYEIRWEEPKPGVRYCLGADTSEGLSSSDPNGLGIMRRDTGRQVAAVHGRFNPRVLAGHICRMAADYNRALIGIERENHGHAVIQKVIDLGVHEPHYRGGQLYYHKTGKPKSRKEQVEKAGWSTNAISRPVMLDAMAEYLTAPDAEERIKDREMLSECLTFRLQKSGKWEHDPGCHDDTIFKWGIANQMRLTRLPTAKFIG